MRQITHQDDVAALGAIMCIWAHPDDETFGMGGIIASAVQNGQKVVCVTATRGEKGVQDEERWPSKELGLIRTKELEDALKILGVSDHHWLDYSDGDCEGVDMEESSALLATMIAEYNPDSVFTFGPDGLTGHPDHKAVSAWTSNALNGSKGKPKLYHLVLTTEQYNRTRVVDNELKFFFNTQRPVTKDENDASVCLRLTDGLLDQKLRALAAMASQYQVMFDRFDIQTVKGCFNVEAFVSAN